MVDCKKVSKAEANSSNTVQIQFKASEGHVVNFSRPKWAIKYQWGKRKRLD